MRSRLTQFCFRGHWIFHFMKANFGLASTCQTRPPPRHTAHLFSLRAAVPRALNTMTEPSSACPKSGWGRESKSGARQMAISPTVHTHPAMIRRTCTRVHFACALGEFPTPFCISDRIPMVRHGERMVKLMQVLRVRYHCECQVGKMDARA